MSLLFPTNIYCNITYGWGSIALETLLSLESTDSTYAMTEISLSST